MRMLGLTTLFLAAGLALAGPASAQNTAAPAEAAAANTTAPANATAPAAASTVADPTLNADGTPKTAPVAHIGQPTDGWISLQPQVTPTGHEALWFHNWILMPLIIAISVFVLLLLIGVMFFFREGRNPVPSKNSHNTLIEIIWTLVPVLILIVVAVPSIRLLAAQFKPAPDNAVTLKAIGNQWYWSYEYPDNGGIQLTSNMLKEKGDPSLAPGARYRTDADGPRLLATDQRVVLPVGVPIRLITTSQDVIHSWSIPAFWIKLDAVPGKLNETSFTIEKPGVYFGVCSELCGQRHGYMPITVEAVSPEVFAQWVKSKGGTMPSAAKPSAAQPAQPGSDAAPKTTMPANAAGPVVDNATANEAAPANASAGSH
jgi:cytochrome c oxidase subunit 2